MLIGDRNSTSSTKSSSLVTDFDSQHSTIFGQFRPNKNATRHLAIAHVKSTAHLIYKNTLEELRSANPEVTPSTPYTIKPIVIPIASTHGILLHLRYLSTFLPWLSSNYCEDLFGACERSVNPPLCDLQRWHVQIFEAGLQEEICRLLGDTAILEHEDDTTRVCKTKGLRRGGKIQRDKAGCCFFLSTTFDFAAKSFPPRTSFFARHESRLPALASFLFGKSLT